NYKIKYSLAPESAPLGKPNYILDIDSSKIGSEFSVKIYEETYVYAPHGGITYKDMVFVNDAITYSDYKAIYLDEGTMNSLIHYDKMLSENNDLGLTNQMAAAGIMYYMNNPKFEQYTNLNELMASVSSAATFASVPLIFVAGSSAAGWTILGIALTVMGAGSTAYCAFNNITKGTLQDDLRDLYDGGNLNAYIACYDVFINDSFAHYMDANWNGWDGKYINRIIGDSVLNVGVNLKGYDVDRNSIVDFSSANFGIQ
ncbi:MAG TPA: hypothetical protein PLS20_05715, partial [Ruminococcus flavefaciens]|nr:hypothetical protein [Ruminococcus flavefaciens]